MAGDMSLLERMRAVDAGRRPTPGREDPAVLADSILENLREVLNSRADCCESRRDYGLPDFNDYVNRFPDAIPAIGRAVKEQVEAFEPRLRGVDVRHVEDPDQPLSLCFHIDAWFELAGKRHRIAVSTVVADDGYVHVRG